MPVPSALRSIPAPLAPVGIVVGIRPVAISLVLWLAG